MNSKQINRRKFLTLAGLTVTAGGLACCGLSMAAPITADPIEVLMSSYTYGDKTKQKSILIAYSSSFGSTMDAASMMGQILNERGFAVDVRPIAEIDGFEGYDLAVLGSAIHGGLIMPEMKEFILANQSVLQNLPVAVFTMGLAAEPKYLDSVPDVLQPKSTATFTGIMRVRGVITILPENYANNIFLRSLLTIFGWIVPVIDRRNPEEIRGWAGSLFEEYL